jgi:hypothetical protein
MNKQLTSEDIDWMVFLQDNEFMGLVEPIGAEEIKGSARKAGYTVELGDCFFNVVYSKKIMVVVK